MLTLASFAPTIVGALLTKVIPSLVSTVRSKRPWSPVTDISIVEASVCARLEPLDLIQPAFRLLLSASTSTEAVKAFLASDELESLLRQIVAGISSQENIEPEVSFRLNAIISGFFPDLTEQARGTVVEALQMSLNKAAELSLGALIETRTIPEESFLVGGVQQLLSDEISALKKEVEKPLSLTPQDISKNRKFAEGYIKHIGSQNKYLIPPSPNESKEIPIDRLYVAANFTAVQAGARSGTNQLISRKQLLSTAYRIVILGNPGGGKSTFAKKLCHDLWTQKSERIFGNRSVLPFFVLLKDYASKRNENGMSIVDFIVHKCKSDFQMEDVPDGCIERLLRTGRGLVIFDGLDELLDTADRLEIKYCVEHFCDEYPSAPILVTSRKVGYEQAPLDDARFEAYVLTSFDEEQVSEYATKWFALNSVQSVDEQKSLCRSFLAESAIVNDIRSNPLMLALMCNLYKEDGYIPRNRPDVYARCADLLFTKWDKKRNIKHGLGMEHQIRPAMNVLAFWIYSNKHLQDGVTEDALVNHLADYLGPQYETRSEAEARSADLISFCRGRAWVFSDTGTNQNTNLYGFTHRTFLEFFTAEHLVRTHRSPQDLLEQLAPRIYRREWDIVSQLALQLKAGQFEGATDEIISRLLDAAEKGAGLEKMHTLVFLSKTLEFLVPVPHLRRQITEAIISTITSDVKNLRSLEARASTNDLDTEALRNLVGCSEDNWPVVLDEIVKGFTSRTEGLDHSIAASTCLLLEALPHLVPGGRGQRVRAIFDASILATTETRNKIDENNLELSIYTWWRSGAKRETARALVERFGVKAFFTPVEAVLSQVWMWPIANSCLNSLLSKRTINDFTDFQRECIEISNLILVNHERIKHLELPTEAPDFLGISPGEPLKDWPSNPKLAEAIVVLFVSCALSCPEFEAEPNEIGLAELAIIFSVMRSKGELLSATEVLGTLPLSKKTQDIVIQWIVSARTKPRGTQAHDEDATNGTPAGPA